MTERKPTDDPMSATTRLILLGLLAFATGGCFTPDMDVRARSAMEQQLLSVALDRAVAKLELPPDTGKATHVVVRGPENIDRDLIRMAIQKRLAEIPIAILPADLASRLEVWATVAGNDTDRDLIGIPIPIGTNTLDVGLWSMNVLWGRVRLSLVLWDPTGGIQWQSNEVEGSAYYSETTILTVFGPFPSTDIPDFERPRRTHGD